MVKDFRYDVRVLFRAPIFTLIAAASLAVGIGGAAVVFTVLNAVLPRALPVPNPHQLFAIEKAQPGCEPSWTQHSWPFVFDARRKAGICAELFVVPGVPGALPPVNWHLLAPRSGPLAP